MHLQCIHWQVYRFVSMLLSGYKCSRSSKTLVRSYTMKAKRPKTWSLGPCLSGLRLTLVPR